MVKKGIVTLLLFATLGIKAQTGLTGSYGDWNPYNGKALTTELDLKPDGTFYLRTPDYVFPATFKDFACIGNWIANGNEVTLNPELERREPEVYITEKLIPSDDSITFKINYSIDFYKDQKLVGNKTPDFQMLTLYFGKRKNYTHLVRHKMETTCGFAPRIRNQKIVDSTNTFKVAKSDFKKIGVNGYGFVKPVEVARLNPMANYIEVNVMLSVDEERMPRSKKVIIKGKRAYFYEINGEVSTFWLEPLYKKAQKATVAANTP
ncbi:hypothetical protein [Flavobacterium wongokense]|uniref:hypothetical protein n=1 Tax=Flavobacterium wongokense TaxID=2910674 RepID=UPI001F3FAC5E|nr:hypothetical protein [Flavobacterium sp. WG47]MCF6133281.1 hypothetical protein [Flavobacterium sp. WG47]